MSERTLARRRSGKPVTDVLLSIWGWLVMAFLFAPIALIFFTVSSLNRMCRVAFRRRAVTVGVLSSAIYSNCQQPLEAQKRNTPTLDARQHRITA